MGGSANRWKNGDRRSLNEVACYMSGQVGVTYFAVCNRQ